jgi:hypothetical protein
VRFEPELALVLKVKYKVHVSGGRACPGNTDGHQGGHELFVSIVKYVIPVIARFGTTP